MATSSADALSGKGLKEKCEIGPPGSVPVLPAAPENEREFKAGKWEFMILGTMALLNITLVVDATILPPALPVGRFLVSIPIIHAFLLANAVFVPFLGAVSDLFGRQAVLLFSVAMFTAGTIVACLAAGCTALLCGRAIQGVGAASIYALSYIVTTDIIPLRQRPKFQSVIVASWALGTIIGPLTGGVVAEHARWQWIFYVNFPFCALGFLAVPVAFRHLKLRDQPAFTTALRRVDWIGSALFMSGTSSFLLGLTWGGVQYAWNAYPTWLPILLGGLAMVASLVYEACLPPAAPFIRMSVFENPSACLVFLLCVLAGFELYAHLYYLVVPNWVAMMPPALLASPVPGSNVQAVGSHVR
ncbi:putative MFS-type transporter YusP [Madurella mycetomatis]|uniref:MFS-type transporter YusP n=1 Tax=Madurella mycetomatis TaxID=100816 RepID=A0A175VN75_9PEZI|nr:putative MFS-type transporter YusP [Madurella mycetomatis]